MTGRPWDRYSDQCPDCRVTLEADQTDVWCWRCRRGVRLVDDSSLYSDLYLAVTGTEAT